MTFFIAQFLHATTDRLPEMFAAVLLSMAAAAAVRFGLQVDPSAARPRRGPRRTAGRHRTPPGSPPARPSRPPWVAGFALIVGQLVSDERWYWAVGSTWWVFVNTTSRGETRSAASAESSAPSSASASASWSPSRWPDLRGAHGRARRRLRLRHLLHRRGLYTWMMLCVTPTRRAALRPPGLPPARACSPVLRLVEPAWARSAPVLAVLLVLPVTTHAVTDAWIQRALRCVHACTAEAAARLAPAPRGGADPAPRVAELEQLLGRVRMSVAPLVHPLNPMYGRKRRARRVLALLDDCAQEIRGLVAVAADPEASHDARWPPPAACRDRGRGAHRRAGRFPAHADGPRATEPGWPTSTAWNAPWPNFAAPLQAPPGSPLVGA
ncbi:FUSC family protein [Streptomyces thinghirensis]|nr:FUSC family protein [Streptomyces thinghirensis]